MCLCVCIVGIDGSGKSTISARLPLLVAGELHLRVGLTGEIFAVVEAQHNQAADPHPSRLPWTAACARTLRWLAKRFVNNRRIYPLFKMAQLLLQDATAKKMIERYRLAVLISDGNAVLSALGRAGNYRRPASEGLYTRRQSPDSRDFLQLLTFLNTDRKLPVTAKPRLPRMSTVKCLRAVSRWLNPDTVWLPDAVVFLDLTPAEALRRIKSRGRKLDRHENLADLGQARDMYAELLRAFQAALGPNTVLRVRVDRQTERLTLRTIVDYLGDRFSRPAECCHGT